MRMFPFSSWISESRGENPVHGVGAHNMADAKPEPPLAAQVVAKRKRDDTSDASVAQEDALLAAKRRKIAATGPFNNTPVQLSNLDGDNTVSNMNITPKGVLDDVVESQLSLEILLTHNELRIINQGLAKAQAALEQLRRCHLIPFPITQQTLAAKLNICSGTGPAMMNTRLNDPRPQWAAPYGVTDGPYSRHYARWLIPDASFDGVHPDWDFEKIRVGRTTSEGRSTRHGTDFLTPGAKSRTQRGSLGQKLQALPSGYTPSKGPAGPSVLKRPDGQLVKLVCLDCRREDFGSTQGFINHCRIAHKREFKSHEEAAVQSGVPIELDDVGGIVGEEKAPSVPTGLVHPLIRTANPDRAAYAAVLTRINQSLNKYNQGKLPGVTSIPGLQATMELNTAKPMPKSLPCPEAPNLSNYLRIKALSGDEKVFTGNVADEVHEAKKQTDFSDDLSEDSDFEKSSSSQVSLGLDGTAEYPAPAVRMPARAASSVAPFGASFTRPTSSKGPENNFSRKPTSQLSGIQPRLPYATPINTTTAVNHSRPAAHIASVQSDHSSDEEADSDIPMLDTPSIHDLSPHTITSNNAPSLVSDDGEYDEGDDYAESSVDGSDGEDNGSDVAEIDFEDGDGDDKVLPATALRHRGALRKEDKHVTFMSPVKERRNKSRSG